jgi:hypothetical protein
MDSAEIASVSLNDTPGADQQLLDDAIVMSEPADWIDWTSQLNETAFASPSPGGAMLSNWDSLDTEYSRVVNAHLKDQRLGTNGFNGSVSGAEDPAKGSSLFEGSRKAYGAHLSRRGNVLWDESGEPKKMGGLDPPGTQDRNEIDSHEMDGPEPSSDQDQNENYSFEPLDQGCHSLSPYDHSSLSPSEDKRLLAIVMPGHKQTADCPSPGAELPISPISSGLGRASEPPGKRKASPDLHSSRKARKSNHIRPASKQSLHTVSHNATEKKYRRNLNCKIDTLRQCVPSLCLAPFSSLSPSSSPQKSSSSKSPITTSHEVAKKSPDEGDDDNAQEKPQRCTKATIITKAREHILDQERAIKRLGVEVAGYRARIDAFDALERGRGRVRAAYWDL